MSNQYYQMIKENKIIENIPEKDIQFFINGLNSSGDPQAQFSFFGNSIRSSTIFSYSVGDLNDHYHQIFKISTPKGQKSPTKLIEKGRFKGCIREASYYRGQIFCIIDNELMVNDTWNNRKPQKLLVSSLYLRSRYNSYTDFFNKLPQSLDKKYFMFDSKIGLVLIDARTKKSIIKFVNRKHRSRNMLNFVTNSTFTDVVDNSRQGKEDESAKIVLYSLKLRKKVAQSYPVESDWCDSNRELLRTYVSPDARLLVFETHSVNNLNISCLTFFKIDFPTVRNPEQKYAVHFIDSLGFCHSKCGPRFAYSHIFFCEPVFLQKVNGVLYFMMMKNRQLYFYNKEKGGVVTQADLDSKFCHPAEIDFFAFDGKHVFKHDSSYPLDLNTFVNTAKSRQWMFENTLRNTHGWAEGWRNRIDFDQILPMNVEGKPAYLPKDSSLNSHTSTSILSFTTDWNICKLTFSIGDDVDKE